MAEAKTTGTEMKPEELVMYYREKTPYGRHLMDKAMAKYAWIESRGSRSAFEFVDKALLEQFKQDVKDVCAKHNIRCIRLGSARDPGFGLDFGFEEDGDFNKEDYHQRFDDPDEDSLGDEWLYRRYPSRYQ